MVWLSLATGALLLAYPASVWLARIWIEGRVKSSFDIEMERVRSDLRATEDRLKIDLQSKQSEIGVLREAALGGRTSRRNLADHRRLAAVDNIWQAVVGLGQLKTAAVIAGPMDIEKLAQIAQTTDSFRDFFNQMAPTDIFKNPSINIAAKERPFVSEITWAVYQGYLSVVLHGCLRLRLIAVGQPNLSEVIDDSTTATLVTAILPHRAAFVQKNGFAGTAMLLDEIEELLVKEIRRELAGGAYDEEDLKQSATILAAVNAAEKADAAGRAAASQS